MASMIRIQLPESHRQLVSPDFQDRSTRRSRRSSEPLTRPNAVVTRSHVHSYAVRSFITRNMSWLTYGKDYFLIMLYRRSGLRSGILGGFLPGPRLFIRGPRLFIRRKNYLLHGGRMPARIPRTCIMYLAMAFAVILTEQAWARCDSWGAM